MLCKKPYTRQGGEVYGCGQCMPCRINRRRLWTHRMILEALFHERASFVTLTYNDNHLPEGGTLVPSDLQKFLKRVRKNISPVRFFGVGEYGDLSERPHYHLALFGLDRSHDDQLRSCWLDKDREPIGFLHVGDLTLHSAGYIAGYVVKKMTSHDDERLCGRFPEFARMSLRPGIGSQGMSAVAQTLRDTPGWEKNTAGDVPGVLRHGSRIMPVGRYLRHRLRSELGVSDNAKLAFQNQRSSEVLALYQNYLNDEKKEGRVPLSIRHMVITQSAQKILNMETRYKIFNSKVKPL